jgi:hypothetical protein
MGGISQKFFSRAKNWRQVFMPVAQNEAGRGISPLPGCKGRSPAFDRFLRAGFQTGVDFWMKDFISDVSIHALTQAKPHGRGNPPPMRDYPPEGGGKPLSSDGITRSGRGAHDRADALANLSVSGRGAHDRAEGLKELLVFQPELVFDKDRAILERSGLACFAPLWALRLPTLDESNLNRGEQFSRRLPPEDDSMTNLLSAYSGCLVEDPKTGGWRELLQKRRGRKESRE